MLKLLAQNNSIPLGNAPFTGVGPLGTSGANAPVQFQDTISKIIGVMTVVAFIWFTFQMIIGAIRIVSSGGDKNALEGAKKQITTGIIGVIMVVAAIFLVATIGRILGLNGSILNPTCVINNSC